MQRNKAFTLIELLVVISVISLLSSIVFASVQESQAQARDVKKQIEAAEVKKALVLYEFDNGSFPGVAGTKYREGTTAFNSLFQDELVDKGYYSQIPDTFDDSFIYVRLNDNSSTRGIISVDMEQENNSTGLSSNSCQPTSSLHWFLRYPTTWSGSTLNFTLYTPDQGIPTYTSFEVVYPSDVDPKELDPATDWLTADNGGLIYEKIGKNRCESYFSWDPENRTDIRPCPSGVSFDIAFTAAYYGIEDFCEGSLTSCVCGI